MSSDSINNNSVSTPLNRTVTTRRSASVSSVSGTTTPSADRRRIENAATVGLLQLATNAASPVAPPHRPNISAEQQEEMMERRLYASIPATGDSEEEPSDSEVEVKVESEDEFSYQFDDWAVFDDTPMGETTNSDEPVMFGAPAGWIPPTSIPEDFVAEPTDANIKKGQPKNFKKVDNPGKWSQLTYQPKFGSDDHKKNKYLYHALPTGATPVPKGKGGKRTQKHFIGKRGHQREAGTFEFHYDGWKNPGTPFRDGATREEPFPAARKGSLCGSTLARLGLSKARMLQDDGAPDSLFFYQAILPIHDPKRTGVENDPRMPFYHNVAKWSNTYASNELDMGNGYGHDFRNVTIDEMVRWDGVIVLDGAYGGSRGAILRRFDNSREDNLSYCKYTSAAFTKTRFLEVKRVMKLCDNSTAPKRGDPGYDPAFKYDYIFKTIVHNTNAITRNAGADLCCDETTFGHMGFGPSDTGLLVRQKNKMVSKGCQIVLVSDVDRIRPRCYIHRHKLHFKYYTQDGQTEMRHIWEKMSPLLVRHPTDGPDENEDPNAQYKPRSIFSKTPLHL